jgi:hypothetical protein
MEKAGEQEEGGQESAESFHKLEQT